MIEAVIYGVTPKDKIEKVSRPPPPTRLIRFSQEESLKLPTKSVTFTFGTVMNNPSLYTNKTRSVNRILLRSSLSFTNNSHECGERRFVLVLIRGLL